MSVTTRERERESVRGKVLITSSHVEPMPRNARRDGRNCEDRSVPLIRREIARTICPISLSFGRLQF